MLNNSIKSISSSELINDSIALSKVENGCDEIEQQSSEIDAAAAFVAEYTVNGIIEELQLEQVSVDLTTEWMLRDERICKTDEKALFLPNITTKSDLKQSEYAINITDNEIDTSKSTAIEIAAENPPLDCSITEEIGSAVKIAAKSGEIVKNTSSTNVSINGLKDEPKDGNIDTAINDGSIAAFLPLSDIDAIFSPSGTSSGHTTPANVAEHEQATEDIHAIVHEIMASVDKLFECVF